MTNYSTLICLLGLFLATCSSPLLPAIASDAPSKPAFVEWLAPKPPSEDTPEAWLAWGLKAQKGYDDEQALMGQFYPDLRDKYARHFEEISKLREIAIDKLVGFGEPSIKLCVDLTVARKSPNIPLPVLQRLGLPAVRPLMDAVRLHPECVLDVEEVFRQSQINCGNLLAHMASDPADVDKAAAAKVLACFADKYSEKATGHALEIKDCVDEKYRPALLAELKTETRPEVRCDLIAIHNYFKSPDSSAIQIFGDILKTDNNENVRKMAALALALQLDVLNVKFYPLAITPIEQAFSTEKSAMVLNMCCGALYHVRGHVDPALIAELRKASDASDQRLRSAALGVLCHFAPANVECLPDVIAALKSKEEYVVTGAVTACHKLGPAAKPAAPALRDVIRDNSFGLTPQAAEALNAIYPAP